MTIYIRQVDGDEYSEELQALHMQTFADYAPQIKPDGEGYWWLAFTETGKPIGFLGLIQSIYDDYGYFSRVGVLPEYRGQGLQKRLMRAMERQGKKVLKWKGLVSDTTDNPASANNFVACGWKTFIPLAPWSFATAIYWYKDFR